MTAATVLSVYRCLDCDAQLTEVEASPVHLRRGERLCDACWFRRLETKTLGHYIGGLAGDVREADALLAGLRDMSDVREERSEVETLSDPEDRWP